MTRRTQKSTDRALASNSDGLARKTSMSVRIRSTQLVHELFLQKQIALTATEEGAVVALKFRPPTPEEEEMGAQRWDSTCTATFTMSPPASVIAILENLAAGRMPPRSTRDPKKYPDIPESGEIPTSLSAPADLLPEFFREWIRKVHRQLHAAKLRAINLVRWRAALEGSHNPLRSAGNVQWSLNGEQWHEMPGSLTANVGLVSALTLKPETLQLIKELAEKGVDEPLGHQLHREAWAQHLSNPRSALAIGMAAAEIGFKRLVGDLVPAAAWMVENVASPPLVDMLTGYLPTLPVRLRIGDRTAIPPWIIEILKKKGVTTRNKLLHRGDPPRADTVREVLGAVKDLLWLLDYYTGNAWALEHLSRKSRVELGLPEGYTTWWESSEME